MLCSYIVYYVCQRIKPFSNNIEYVPTYLSLYIFIYLFIYLSYKAKELINSLITSCFLNDLLLRRDRERKKDSWRNSKREGWGLKSVLDTGLETGLKSDLVPARVLFLYISGRILNILFWNYVSSLRSTHFTSFYFYRSSRFSQRPEHLIKN